MIVANTADDRELARRRLPLFLFDYIDGGSFSELTLRRNVSELEAIILRQRVMKDVSVLDTSTTLFGDPVSMPLALAPVGFSGMFAKRGEVQGVRAAQAAGVGFTLSTMSICSIEEVRAAAQRPIWFQLYMIKDRGYMVELLARAAALGTGTLMFTVDLPVSGTRYRDMRSGFSNALTPLQQMRRALHTATRPAWVRDVYLGGRPHHFGNLIDAIKEKQAGDFVGWIHRNFDPTVTWNDVAWVRRHWAGKIVIKGILDPEDARSALAAGADGVVVSNHGGRQLDGVLPAITALPPVVEAVGDAMTVLMDGGVRSGLDILKALALGAKGVLIGRAWAYALAAGGEAGVARMLARMQAELRVAMTLTGCTDVKQAGTDLLIPNPPGRR
jgi:L-lactate dehydrogenase (cytochrome)